MQCCTNPASCVDGYTSSVTPTNSIKNGCNQNHTLGNAAAQSNTQAASQCTVKYNACDSTCTSAGLSDKASSCRDLSSYASQYASLGGSNYDVAAQSLDCQENASASPSGGSGGSSSKDNADMNTASTSANSEACAANPSGPGCGQAAASQTMQAANDASAKLSDGASPNANYNVGDTSGVGSNPSYGGGGAGPGGGNGVSVKPIANNSGGGMMGGGAGGGANGGILGGNGGGGMFGGSASGKADIDRGLRSGGYSTTPGAEDEKPDAPPEGGGRGLASEPGAAGGLDLKQYLPGGRLSADTLRAAAMEWRSKGIHPSHIDLWFRISEKMQEKCKLGELLGCP